MRLAFEDQTEGEDAETARHEPVLILGEILDVAEMADQAGDDQGHGNEKQQQGKG